MSDAATLFMMRRRVLFGFAAKLLGFTLLGILIFIWLGPVLLVVMTSIKSNDAFLAGPFALPTQPTFQPYITVWNALGFGPLMANSFLYATAGSALAVALALVPAFGLSRLEIPGKKLIFGVILTGLMLPQQTVLIPLYDTLRSLNLLDTKLGLIIVHAAYGMPAQILMLRGFMTAIPREIEKAAYLEGASDFEVFWKVILPLSVPGILVGFTLNFIAIWKEFVFGLVLLNSEANFPVTVGMLKLNSDRYMSVFNLPAAGLVISQIPIVILFLLTYRKISGGNFAGAVKG
ncbi:MAG: carbohydrate ABC transporter permease [Candidatus Competibacteraceae bacterium]|nr:carbohydrate ABC transporter permease [Candidatus Competibacteraceae bacterium]